MDEETREREINKLLEEQREKDQEKYVKKESRFHFVMGAVFSGIILYFVGFYVGYGDGIHRAKLATMKNYEREFIDIYGFDRGYGLSEKIKDRMWNPYWMNTTTRQEISVLEAD